MFEWCSISVISTSSPLPMKRSPKERATRLIDPVVPLVKMISRLSLAPMKRWILLLERLESLGRLAAQLVQSAVDVGTVGLVVAFHGLDHGPWLLCGGRVVQVDQRLAVHPSLEYGEVVP